FRSPSPSAIIPLLPRSSFPPSASTVAVRFRLLWCKLPGCNLKASPHIESRLKTLKKHCDAITNMKDAFENCDQSSLESSSSPACIYLKPRVVAIGPLHKEDEELQDIESHKVTYLLDLFLRLPSMPNQKMDECIQRVYAKVEQIRACYAGEMKDYDDGEVAKMMVIDGCFILEFILRVRNHNHPDDDPIFYNKLVYINVAYDLVLLENQIPFFVLQDIFKCTILEFSPSSSLQSLVFSFLRPIYPFDKSYVTNINDGVDTSYDHILGLLQKFCQPADAMPSEFSVTRFHSVEELTVAGVNFKRN
ncbi:Protein of unknown function DUF247, plant, partial [Cynara cardunculus var. scolymus]